MKCFYENSINYCTNKILNHAIGTYFRICRNHIYETFDDAKRLGDCPYKNKIYLKNYRDTLINRFLIIAPGFSCLKSYAISPYIIFDKIKSQILMKGYLGFDKKYSQLVSNEYSLLNMQYAYYEHLIINKPQSSYYEKEFQNIIKNYYKGIAYSAAQSDLYLVDFNFREKLKDIKKQVSQYFIQIGAKKGKGKNPIIGIKKEPGVLYNLKKEHWYLLYMMIKTLIELQK